jgi:hypothetical protein
MSCIQISPKTIFAGLLALAYCLAGASTVLRAESSHVRSEESKALEAGFRQMYNLDFPAAHKTFEEWQQLHPDNPLGPAANAAAYLFSEFERLHILEIELFTDKDRLKKRTQTKPDPDNKAAFERELTKADRIAAEVLARSTEDRDALFARVLSDGLRGNYAALIEKRDGPGLDFLKSSRSTAEKLIKIDPEYYDAYLAIGLENYLLGVRSAPVRWMLKLSGGKTNKKEGIARLKVTADKGFFLAPYAQLLLAIAAERDRDKRTAIDLLSGLAREFPNNPLYRSELARLYRGD